MDGLCEYLHTTAWPGMKYDEKVDGFEALEMYAHEGLTKVRTMKISDDDAVSWLDRSEVVDDNNADFLRLVWIKRGSKRLIDPWETEITKENEDLVLKHFDLKNTHRIAADGSLICLPVEDQQELNRQHFAVAMFGYTCTLIWTHHLRTSRTDAVLYDNNSLLQLSSIIPVLESQKRLARHPMFLAFVIALFFSQWTQIMVGPISDKINQVENRTQHCPATLLSGNSAEGDYAALSAMMSGCATRLACVGGRLQNLEDILDSITGYTWPQIIEQPEWAETIAKAVNECVSVMKRTIKGQEQRVRYLTHRADIQLNALFNLITQQETRVSISVAEDSRTLALATKDDSTAMRTLAAVTVFFLPGTFVAAFFSMPLFHWDAQTGALSTVVSGRFWVYWAVTGPLTLVTITLWLVWMRLQTRRRRARDSEGREALYHEIKPQQREFRKRFNDMLKRE